MNVDVVGNWTAGPIVEAYEAPRAILYALGLGIRPEGDELRYVFERELRAFPTLAVMLANEGFWLQDSRTGVNWAQIVHGGQTLELHRPLAPTGKVVGQMQVDALIDRGTDKGAAIHYTRVLRDAETDELIATVGMTVILRGDGGFCRSFGVLPQPPTMPDRPADASVALETRPELAAIYRLSGDFNPLHIDPAFASSVGFERPILHGLCTYGVAARAGIAAMCDGDPDRLRRFDARFSAPVYPGETLATEIWREQDGQAAFRTRAVERDVVVLNNGLARWID